MKRPSLLEPDGPALRGIAPWECRHTAATTAAMIGILGMAGGSAVSAVVQSNAAKKAAQIQANSAQTAINAQTSMSQQALDFAKQQWATQQANMAPYLQYGRGALSTLGGLMGISPDMSVGGSGAPGATAPLFQAGGPGSDPNQNLQQRPYGNAPATLGALHAPGLGTPQVGGPVANGGGMAPSAPPQGFGNTAPPPPQTASSTGGAVRIAWPDGTQQTVDASQLQNYLSLGAQQVNA